MKQLTDPLIDKNPVAVHILGICSALAVTTSMATALTMSVALTVVVTLAAGLISALRSHIPNQIRIIVQLTIIATLVILADLLLQGFAHDMSQRLTVFVSLIATNCIVLGRTEAYAMHNPPLPSMIDALGIGMPLFFLSGVAWPVEMLPQWMQRVALAAPSTSAIPGMVRVNQMGASWHDVMTLVTTLWLLTAGYAVALAGLHFRSARRRRRSAREAVAEI